MTPTTTTTIPATFATNTSEMAVLSSPALEASSLLAAKSSSHSSGSAGGVREANDNDVMLDDHIGDHDEDHGQGVVELSSSSSSSSFAASSDRCLTVAAEVPRLAVVALAILSRLVLAQPDHDLKRTFAAQVLGEGEGGSSALGYIASRSSGGGSSGGDQRTAEQALEVLRNARLCSVLVEK